MDYAKLPEYKNHELILEGSDKKSCFQSFIAIHNSNLGPALGGTRIVNYSDTKAALRDVLRLSKAMTYKCAIAGVPFGGGKGVIFLKSKTPKALLPKILRLYAEQVDSLKGRFHTGEDVGISEKNVQYMLKFSPYFIGKSHLAGDPSPYAGLSAFYCIQTVLKHVFGSEKISGKTFAIKGVGKTGSSLVKLLYEQGAEITISDTDPKQIKKMVRLYPKIKTISSKDINGFKADVYCPCAMGDDIKKNNFNKIKAQIICGTANNQIEDENISEKLYKLSILHVPDYIANSGGLINVADELLSGGYKKSRVVKTINEIKKTLTNVLEVSSQKMISPDKIADRLAESRFNKIHQSNVSQ